MPAKNNLYDQLLAMGFSKREIDQQLHHVVMWYIREGKTAQLLASSKDEDEPSILNLPPSATRNQPASGNLQQETSNLQPTSIFNRIRHALHLIQTQFAKKPKNPV